MAATVLHSHIGLFEERNLFLYFALGLLSHSRGFMTVIEWEAEAVSGSIPARTAESMSSEDVDEDRLLNFVLGLVAVSRRFDAQVETERAKQVAASHPVSTLDSSADEQADAGSLLF